MVHAKICKHNVDDQLLYKYVYLRAVEDCVSCWRFTFCLSIGMQNLAPGESFRGAIVSSCSWLVDSHIIVLWKLIHLCYVIVSIF